MNRATEFVADNLDALCLEYAGPYKRTGFIGAETDKLQELMKILKEDNAKSANLVTLAIIIGEAAIQRVHDTNKAQEAEGAKQ